MDWIISTVLRTDPWRSGKVDNQSVSLAFNEITGSSFVIMGFDNRSKKLLPARKEYKVSICIFIPHNVVHFIDFELYCSAVSVRKIRGLIECETCTTVYPQS
jgi:hypothetical protein